MSGYAFGSAGSTTDFGNTSAVPAPGAPASIAAGDLLIVGVVTTTPGSTGGSYPTLSTPSGWSLMPSGAQANPFKSESTTVGEQMGLYYRWATGTDTMPSWTLAAIYKYAAQAFRYTGGPGAGAPLASFTSGPSGTANTNTGPAPTASLAVPSWFAEIYSQRTTTNTTYANITGMTNRGKVFGSGGGAVDLAMYDSNGDASGTVGGDTAVVSTGGSWGIGALILLPAPAGGFTGWGMPL